MNAKKILIYVGLFVLAFVVASSYWGHKGKVEDVAAPPAAAATSVAPGRVGRASAYRAINRMHNCDRLQRLFAASTHAAARQPGQTLAYRAYMGYANAASMRGIQLGCW